MFSLQYNTSILSAQKIKSKLLFYKVSRCKECMAWFVDNLDNIITSVVECELFIYLSWSYTILMRSLIFFERVEAKQA